MVPTFNTKIGHEYVVGTGGLERLLSEDGTGTDASNVVHVRRANVGSPSIVITLWLTGTLAFSAPAAHAQGTNREGPTAPRAEVDYRLPVALGYFVPLSLVVLGGVALSASSSPWAYAVGTIGAVGTLAAPPLVHAAYGNGRGAATAVFGILGSVSAGFFVGAGAWYAFGHPERRCDEDERTALSVCAIGHAIIPGGAVGAGLGYLTWGVIDTALNAHTYERASAPSIAFRLLPTWAPPFGGEHVGALNIQGISLGAAGTF